MWATIAMTLQTMQMRTIVMAIRVTVRVAADDDPFPVCLAELTPDAVDAPW